MIDWHNDDGVNLAMINDHVRNQFFDRVLAEHVRDRDCIDIGFGTGLLSVMALQHGARSVTAVESDPERYRLGMEIIARCGLQDRVKLFNLRYQYDMPLYVDNAVIFSETVNGNLWQEGLWDSLPRQPGQVWLPNSLFLEIHAISVPHSFAAGLAYGSEESEDIFDPGVDIGDDFVYEINRHLGSQAQIHGTLDPGLHTLSAERLTPWGPSPWVRSLGHQHTGIGSYELDIEQCSLHIEDAHRAEHYEAIDFDCDSVDLILDCSSSHKRPMIVIPKCGMIHAQDRLYLDRGHWGNMLDPIIVVGIDQVRVRHDVRTGNIFYEVIA